MLAEARNGITPSGKHGDIWHLIAATWPLCPFFIWQHNFSNYCNVGLALAHGIGASSRADKNIIYCQWAGFYLAHWALSPSPINWRLFLWAVNLGTYARHSIGHQSRGQKITFTLESEGTKEWKSVKRGNQPMRYFTTVLATNLPFHCLPCHCEYCLVTSGLAAGRWSFPLRYALFPNLLPHHFLPAF